MYSLHALWWKSQKKVEPIKQLSNTSIEHDLSSDGKDSLADNLADELRYFESLIDLLKFDDLTIGPQHDGF